MTFPQLRARGANSGRRGPQLDDGTFEGVVGPSDGSQPPRFTVIGWAPSEFPGVELWCYRVAEVNDGGNYQPIVARTVSPYDCLYLEKVTEAAFEPGSASGQAPDSAATVVALKQYAHTRWLDAAPHGAQDRPANWVVTSVRPYQCPPLPAVSYERIESGKVYAVYQQPVSGGEFLTSWLWVPVIEVVGYPRGREIWLHYAPNLPGGFTVVGSTPQGSASQYIRTRFRFVEYEVSDYEYWSLSTYAGTIGRFKDWALAHPDSPAHDVGELTVLDYRVSDPL